MARYQVIEDEDSVYVTLQGLRRYTPELVSICEVPLSLRSSNPKAYNPKRISIGPIHHGTNDTLNANESLKETFTNNLLSRVMTYNRRFKLRRLTEHIQKSMFGLCQKDIRRCYGSTIRYSNSRLSKIMMIDGCFILELMYLNSKHLLPTDDYLTRTVCLKEILADLLLLENQIPIRVLTILFDITRMDVAFSLDDIYSNLHAMFHLVQIFPIYIARSLPNGGTYQHILAIMQASYMPRNLDT